ncbi:MAG TPA: carbohydrate ABC transporter permease [Solirubrobacteraceae bacterium]|jgi:sorbitol/mannitol transport system permease protein|nr:carbohydrate ABC transporter permease [Solirubrobacteraceae bacterium]
MSASASARTVTSRPRSRRRGTRSPTRHRYAWAGGLAAWAIALLFVAPIIWMVLTSLHSESNAATNPPSIGAGLTLSGYKNFFDSDPWPYLVNSLSAAVFSTLIVLLLAFPAAYALTIKPVKKWRDVMFFFLSTKFLPQVAAVLPIFLIARDLGLLDHVLALIIVYAAMNLPVAIWMMRSFLAEIPREVVEAAELDGAGLRTILLKILLPLTAPGLAAVSLICFIFSWNELLFARVITATVAETAPVFLTGFITSEGLFLSKLCAAAVIISLPVLIAGFAAQDKLVQGLSFGAVKG